MPNDVSAFIPQVLSRAVILLRENAIMPRLVNSDYSQEVASSGDSVDIPVPSIIKTRDVLPGAAPMVANNDLNPGKIQLKLDNWKDASFSMSDKDFTSISRGVAPRQLEAAVKSLANDIDSSILAQYTDIYGLAGTPGTTPFATSTIEAQEAYRALTIQLAPPGDRRMVLDPFAQSNAIGLSVFQNVNQSGTDETLKYAKIGTRLNFDWYQDQNVTTHVAGTAAGFAVTQNNHAIGDKVATVGGGSGTFKVGDVFKVAGDSQTYAVKTFAGGQVSYVPAAKKPWANNAAITVTPSHTVNLAFHRDCFGFASRPMADVYEGGSTIMSMPDPVSGVVLRLEVSRQNKQTLWSLDCLWGAKCIMPELGCRVMG